MSAELGHASAPPTPYYPSSAPARDFPGQRRGGEPKRKVRRRLGGAAPLPFAVRVLDPERQAGGAAALGRAGPGQTGLGARGRHAGNPGRSLPAAAAAEAGFAASVDAAILQDSAPG